MADALNNAQGSDSLRQRALGKLSEGIPHSARRASAPDALAVLHQLASSPATAADALALLHELQVHQVELEMQREEMRSACLELEAALLCQTAAVAQAPGGLVSMNAQTVLYEANAAAARMLGAAPEELLGMKLSAQLTTRGAEALQSLMARARAGLLRQTCELQLPPLQGVARAVWAAGCLESDSGCFRLVLLEAPPGGREQMSAL